MERAEPAVLTDSPSLGNFEASFSELTPLSGSNHFEITMEITDFCPSGFTAQSTSMTHTWNGCSQSSHFPTTGQGDWRLWEQDWSLLLRCSLWPFFPNVTVKFIQFGVLLTGRDCSKTLRKIITFFYHSLPLFSRYLFLIWRTAIAN